MAKESGSFRLGNTTVGEILDKYGNSQIETIRGVLDEAVLVLQEPHQRIYAKTIVDFTGQNRGGTWVRTSRVISRTPIDSVKGKRSELVQTKNSYYIVMYNPGAEA